MKRRIDKLGEPDDGISLVQGLLRRAWRLATVLTAQPAEFVDRVVGLADRLTDRRHAPITTPLLSDAIWPLLSAAGGPDVAALRSEPALAAAEASLAEQNANLPADAPFGVGNSAEPFVGHIAYVLCRILRPDTVVETGVAYGGLTTYLLSALEANKRGVLHSIDLPPILERHARWVGLFVPQNLRARWTLHLGASRRVLPDLLKKVRPVGLFIHDSLHTQRNMAWEFATATPYLASRAAVLSDDVERNHAFEDWARKTATRWALVREVERPGWLGVALISR